MLKEKVNKFLEVGVSLKSIAADGTVYIWFYRELALGDKLTICFNEFPTDSFTDPVVRSL